MKNKDNIYETNKTCCYGEFYLSPDMDVMGYLFERTKSRYCKDINIEWFISYYMNSLLRYRQEEGFPKLNNMDSEDLFNYILEKEPVQIVKGGPDIDEFHYGELIWIGMAYAYLHYHGDIRSRDLLKFMPFEFMRNAYITGHQLSFGGFFERCEWMIKGYKDQNNIDYTKEDYDSTDFKNRKFNRKLASQKFGGIKEV